MHSVQKPYRIRVQPMKILIFSDTHLQEFEERKYNFLSNIIQDSDRVIINGDFWEGHLMNFDQFATSQWKGLFPLLKLKKAVYIYGNHDDEVLNNHRASLFSDIQTNKYVLNIANKSLILEHGDRLAYLPKRHQFFTKRAMTVEKMMVRRIGDAFHKLVGGRLNNKIKTALKTELKDNEIYVCGHTHYAEIDKSSQFINTGIVRHGLGQYLLIDNDRIVAKEEWYD